MTLLPHSCPRTRCGSSFRCTSVADTKRDITEAAAVCASRSRHINEQDAIPGSEVVPEGVEQTGIGAGAERQRDGTVIRLRDGQGTNGVAAHGGDAAGDAVFRGLVERKILCGIAACRPEGHAHLYLRDGDVGKVQTGQPREVDRALIARGGVYALPGFTACP